MNKVDHERSISEASLAEVRRLREENVRLRSLLTANGIPIPEALISATETPQVASAVPGVRKQEVGKAEQRIALFRSLFFGRDDVYAMFATPPKVFRLPKFPKLTEDNIRTGFLEDAQYKKS